MKKQVLFLTILSIALCTSAQRTAVKKKEVKNANHKNFPLPVIDMHMHANRANFAGPPPMPYCIHVEEWPVSATGTGWLETLMKDTSCKELIMSPKTDEEVMNKTFEI